MLFFFYFIFLDPSFVVLNLLFHVIYLFRLLLKQLFQFLISATLLIQLSSFAHFLPTGLRFGKLLWFFLGMFFMEGIKRARSFGRLAFGLCFSKLQIIAIFLCVSDAVLSWAIMLMRVGQWLHAHLSYIMLDQFEYTQLNHSFIRCLWTLFTIFWISTSIIPLILVFRLSFAPLRLYPFWLFISKIGAEHP